MRSFIDFDYIFSTLASEYAVPLTEHTVTYIENFAERFIEQATQTSIWHIILFGAFAILNVFSIVSCCKDYTTLKQKTTVINIVLDVIMLVSSVVFVGVSAYELYQIFNCPEVMVIEEFIKWCA